MDTDDVTLMMRVRGGDRRAFDLLVQRHSQRVVNMLFRMVGNRHDAEELAQEAFFRAYRARKSYRPDAAFSTWLNRIATNLAINHGRKKRPDRLIGPEPESRSAMPADAAEDAERRRIVWEALQELPVRQRAALVLTRVEGNSYRDAASAMDVSIESVRALVARAREEMRTRLRRVLESDEAKE